MNKSGGYPEHPWRIPLWRVFSPLAWLLVRTPLLRVALSNSGLRCALARAERAIREQ